MSHHFIIGKDELMMAWAARKIPNIGRAEAFGPAKAIGVATGPSKTDRLLAVVVFHEYHPEHRTCQISAVSSSPRWATRSTFRELLAFPFLQYGCNLVWVAIPHTSTRVVDFCKAIGFKQEAILADRFGLGKHAVICRMKYVEYEKRYLKDESNGQKHAITTAGS